MVDVIQVASRRVPHPYDPARGIYTYRTSPLIEIHQIERHVHGNGISLHVYGEMKIAAGEYVFARELKLNTLQTLNLTPEQPFQTGVGYMANKHIYRKGQYDNWASIDIYDDASTFLSPGNGPTDGSIWLNFEAMGE